MSDWAKLSAFFTRIHVDSHESNLKEVSNSKLILLTLLVSNILWYLLLSTMYNGLIHTNDSLVVIRQ